jgi:hypothetical protein
MLSEYLGADLGKVVNELDKLIISLPQGTQISPVISLDPIKNNNFPESCNPVSHPAWLNSELGFTSVLVFIE